MQKYESVLKDTPRDQKIAVYGDKSSENVVLSWGSPKGAILEALNWMEKEGNPFKFVQVKLLWPFPSEELTEELSNAKKIINIENNYTGQLAAILKQQTCIEATHNIVKYNGRPMSIDEVYDSIQLALSGDAPEKVVLTHGA